MIENFMVFWLCFWIVVVVGLESFCSILKVDDVYVDIFLVLKVLEEEKEYRKMI